MTGSTTNTPARQLGNLDAATATSTAAASSPNTVAPRELLPPAAAPGDRPEIAPAEEAQTDDDGNSVYERISSYSASLMSSAINYPVEYGRRYHSFREGVYVLPNDNLEMERLNVSHNMVVRAIGDRLYLAPLEKEKIHKILDVGTGTGIWAIEMGDFFPNAEVFGNDLSPIQPEWVPPNVKFFVEDVESPWIDDEMYDFIFVRHMLVSIADWPKLVKNVYDHLNPGGWAEFQDMDIQYYSDDGTLTEEHETRKWNKQFVAACEGMGRTGRPGPRLKDWVTDAGFQRIAHQRFKLPMGPWPADPHYRDVGTLNLYQLLHGLEGFTLKLFCDYLGQTKEEVCVMMAKVRKELQDPSLHGIFDHHVVFAQKPEASDEEKGDA
ncbi:Secondary metabolism regulator LAE1 [Colletotrichum aenigma]|uniref:Secondary metabolism regulator LAE1 n=1 Tax=Colletotrichum aenigma TaxID=1215731 RepID=UPI001873217C|nr:Secondary metabolism regulator LAE1 [Colletotrichum aenigma]KAF5524263.1 Secondary metabolism regulator LAE1 [Colletotrichum aenigma]